MSWKLRHRLNSICTALFCANDLMKPHGSIRLVKKWRGMGIDPALRCLDDPDVLNNGYLPRGRGP
jgi:hypothetical protein